MGRNWRGLVLLLAAWAPVRVLAQPPALPPGAQAPDAAPAAAAAAATPPSSALEAAEDRMVQQDWKGALALLAPELARSGLSGSEAARAFYDAGFCQDALGQRSDAADAYRKAIAADARQFEAHAALGRLLAMQGDAAAARTELTTAAGLTPAAGDANAARGEVFRELARLERKDDPTAASGNLLQALKLTPETPADTLLSAEIAENAGDTAGAEKAYRKAVAGSPDSVEASAALAHLLIQEKKYAEAQGLVEHLHGVVPQDAEITRLLANLYLETGEAAKAAELNAALTQTPEGSKDPGVYLEQGEALLRQHDPAGAQAAYQRAVTLDPRLVDGWSGLAFAASENRQYQVELDALTARSKLAPEAPATLFLWATAYDNLRQYKPAMAYYKRFLGEAKGNFPDQEFEARHRLIALERMH